MVRRTSVPVTLAALVAGTAVLAALLGSGGNAPTASAGTTARTLTHDHADGHEHGDEGLRSTSSLRREVDRLSARIARQKRVLRRCDDRSGGAERACERRAGRRLAALRSERSRLRREIRRVERTPATPPPAATPTPTPAGTGYSLMWDRYPDARWRCTTSLTYRVNLADAPSNALADVRAAFDLIGSINGYAYTYAGTTTARGASDDADIVLSWTTGQVGSSAGAIAIGGQSLRYGARTRPTLSRGYVQVETGARLTPGMGAEGRRGTTLGRVLVHELGHVMGLSHVDDPAQIMHGVIGAQTTAANTGDRAGLLRQGRVAACA